MARNAPPTAPALTPAALGDVETLFKGFADPTRIRILNLLAAGELCVCDIVALLELPQSTVSRHLAYLLRAGLVTVSRKWKFAHYRLAEPGNPVHGSLLGCVRTGFRGLLALNEERAAAEARVRARVEDPC